jgi:hypothetical protein
MKDLLKKRLTHFGELIALRFPNDENARKMEMDNVKDTLFNMYSIFLIDNAEDITELMQTLTEAIETQLKAN